MTLTAATTMTTTFDPLYLFPRELAKGAAKRLKTLKAVDGASWGPDSETLLLTYKVVIRTKLDCADPVWSTNVKPAVHPEFRYASYHRLSLETR